jgi:hypothetical protein
MKKILILFFSLLTLCFFSQEEPEQGDFIMKTSVKSNSGSYIFKKTLSVYFDYDFTSKNKENKYQQNKKMVDELFVLINKTDFNKIKGLDETKIPTEEELGFYYILEYKKNDKKIRICWDSRSEDKQYQPLNAIVTKMSSFW